MVHQRVVAPGYTYLQSMVGRAVSGELLRITRLLGGALTPAVERQLEALLEADEGMYRISLLKHEPKDFSYGELRQEVARRKFFEHLHEFGQTFLASARLSNESVKYYASLVQFYTVYKLQRMAVQTARLYLLCFAYHRFRQINDNLVEAFIHLVDQYEKQAKLAAETAAMKAMTEASTNLKAAGQVLNLFLDQSIADRTPFSKIRRMAFSLLDPERFALVSDSRCSTSSAVTAQWIYWSEPNTTATSPRGHSSCGKRLARRRCKAGFACRSRAKVPGRRRANNRRGRIGPGATRIWRCATCASNSVRRTTMPTRLRLISG